jgi:hypothetical protein
VVFGWQGDLINRLIHRSWGEGFVALTYKPQEGDVVGITTGWSWLRLLFRQYRRAGGFTPPTSRMRFRVLYLLSYAQPVLADYFLTGFFLGFEREDFGTEKMTPAAAVNRSNGV